MFGKKLKSSKKFLLLSLIFVSFFKNSNIIAMESESYTINSLPSEILETILIEYKDTATYSIEKEFIEDRCLSNLYGLLNRIIKYNQTVDIKDLSVKDFLKLIATQALVCRKWHQISQDLSARIINFCRHNRLDINTLRVSQYFEFHRFCFKNPDYRVENPLNINDLKNYHRYLPQLPAELEELINNPNISVKDLLEILKEKIDSYSAEDKRLAQALVLNIENLYKMMYKDTLEESLVNNFYKSYPSTETILKYLFLGINPNVKCSQSIRNKYNNPLYSTIYYSEKDSCLALLEAGASIKLLEDEGLKPLHLAILEASHEKDYLEKKRRKLLTRKAKEIIPILLNYGANPNLTN